ncbi:hypothetical protein ACQ4PT_048917 [Festuca glaucescens]
MSKRSRSVWDMAAEMGSMDTARVLMLLAQHHQHYQYQRGVAGGAAQAAPPLATSGRVFECKTCSRQFPTFQALGGHRASHKRPRLHLQQQHAPGDGDDGAALCLGRRTVTPLPPPPRQPARPRAHECPVCGLEFAVGQALGGHMRRHRAEAESASPGAKAAPGAASCGDAGGVCLDLNLTPSENCAKCRSVAGLAGAAGQGAHKALAMLDCTL